MMWPGDGGLDLPVGDTSLGDFLGEVLGDVVGGKLIFRDFLDGTCGGEVAQEPTCDSVLLVFIYSNLIP